MKKTSEPIIFMLIFLSAVIMVSSACNSPTNEGETFSLDPRAEDGSVSGRYRSPDDLGDHNVNFDVTTDGFATFRIEGAPESETLTVDLGDDQTAGLEWNGTTLDGLGPLTGEEQAALDKLMDSDLAHSLEIIPLDAGCQGDEEIDAKQVAALLVPLQMRFKYSIADRESEAKRLIALSECDYGSTVENEDGKASFIMFSPSMPVPVVFGYFPFDADGAVEAASSSDVGLSTACLDAPSSGTAAGTKTSRPLAKSLKLNSVIHINEKGPCNALCRGACGADCPLSNCNLKKELRCELDDDGRNTGMEFRTLIYDCGLHQGCIDHDDCYDDCNTEYGCGSWEATQCRHAIVSNPITLFTHPNWFCDQKAIAEHGAIDPPLWSRGYGPQPIRETFEYTDDEYGKQQNLDNCPLEEPDSPPVDEEDGDAAATTGDIEGDIPVGTYVGTTDLPQATAILWGPGQHAENDVIINVADDGTVTGSLSFFYKADPIYDEAENCSSYLEFDIDGSFTGQLTGDHGILELTEIWVIKILGSCEVPLDLDYMEVTLHHQIDIQISGNHMIGSSLPYPEDLEEPFNWTLKAPMQ